MESNLREEKMITVDYETLSVTGDWKTRFGSKEEMEKAVLRYVKLRGQELRREDKPYIFKGQMK